jgi:hypothetical protein
MNGLVLPSGNRPAPCADVPDTEFGQPGWKKDRRRSGNFKRNATQTDRYKPADGPAARPSGAPARGLQVRT